MSDSISLENELAIIKCILEENLLACKAAKELNDCHFLDPFLRVVFQRVKSLILDKKQPLDLLVLKNACDDLKLDGAFWLKIEDTSVITSIFSTYVQDLKFSSTKFLIKSYLDQKTKELKTLNSNTFNAWVDNVEPQIKEILEAYHNKSKESFLLDAVIDSEELINEDIPDPEPLLPPLLYKGQYVGMIGPRGIGKTKLGIAIAIALTRDPSEIMIGPWIGGQSVPVLYLDAEMSEASLKREYQKLSKYQSPRKSRLVFCSTCRLARKRDDENSSIDLLNIEHRHALTEYIKQNNFQVIIIDNLMSFTPTWDNIEKDKFKIVNQWILSLRHLGKSIILVCHTGKDQTRGAMGPADIEFNMDCSIQLSKPKDWRPADLCYFQIEFHKQPRIINGGDSLEPFTFKIVPNGDGGITWRTSEVKVEKDRALISLIIDAALKDSEIAKITETSKGWVSQKRKLLIKDGYIDENNNPTLKGRDYIKGFNYELYYHSK